MMNGQVKHYRYPRVTRPAARICAALLLAALRLLRR